ncbi:MAG: hypothetical protein NC820_07385 [Candidatus Omnitrophica bacterium]|nr:hypothetical protein [Candidatus Omnitrophota bacterium]
MEGKLCKQILVIRIHNIRVKIITNYPKYYDYLCLHFGKVILSEQVDDCQVEVSAYWQTDDLNLDVNTDMIQIGANTLRDENGIYTIRKIGRRKKVKLNFYIKDNKLYLKANFQRKPLKDKLRYDIFGQSQEAHFFEITYPLIYYPLFWYLEYFKNTHPLHASAVKIKDKCIVICGLEGMGKTTFSLLLAQDPHAKLFSDNLIFYDKDNIFPCYEPIRIHKNEDKSLWKDKFSRINKFKTLKDFYEPISFSFGYSSKPDIIILPLFGDTFCVKKIAKIEFIERLLNLNQLTAELGNYTEYFALFNLLVTGFRIWELRYNALQCALNSTDCFEMIVRKADGLEKNLKKLKEVVFNAYT